MSAVESRHASPERFARVVLDLVTAAVVFSILGIIGALVWHQVVDLPHYTRTAQGAEMDGLGLEDLFAINGWFCVIGLVLGLIGGAGLLLWRHREPVWVLVVSAASSVLAGAIMIQLGEALGPDRPTTALRDAKRGATAPVQLALQGLSTGPHSHWYQNPYLYSWLAGCILGTTVILLFVSPRPGPGAVAGTGPGTGAAAPIASPGPSRSAKAASSIGKATEGVGGGGVGPRDGGGGATAGAGAMTSAACVGSRKAGAGARPIRIGWPVWSSNIGASSVADRSCAGAGTAFGGV